MSDQEPEAAPVPTPEPEAAPQEQPAAWTPPSEAEWQAQRSALAAFRRDKEAAEKAAKDAAQKQAEEQGQWRTLAEQAQKDAADAQAKLDGVLQEQTIREKATALKFRRPEYALKLLGDDVDRSDPVAVEAGLRALLENDPDLKASDTPPPSGKQPGGAAPQQSLDEQIAEAEKNADWSTAGALKAQKALAGQASQAAA